MEANANEAIISQIRAALERKARINLQTQPLAVTFADGALTLEGEVPNLACKKQALEAAGAIEGVQEVVDRLRIGVGEGIGDGAIRDAVCQLLLQAVDFRTCAIGACVKGQLEALRAPANPPWPEGERCGSIEVSVENGVVKLGGEVISLTHKRLAGVLAWWAQGVRDVVNALEVSPPEEDTDDEVTDALRLVYESDPRVHAEQIGILTRDHVVTLEGVVGSEDERRIAEQDAWYLYAVDRVINRLEVART